MCSSTELTFEYSLSGHIIFSGRPKGIDKVKKKKENLYCMLYYYLKQLASDTCVANLLLFLHNELYRVPKEGKGS